MSARVTVTAQAVASPPSSAFVTSGQAFIVGSAEKGPDIPVLVRGLADFRAVFGERTGGADLTDVVTTAFKEGLAGAWVLRALGPGAVKATIGLDSGKITVTAKMPGAYANDWTAAYTASSKTLTIVKGAQTATYSGADAAGLQAAAAADADVDVKVTGLPSTNATAAKLTGGTDDAVNVNIEGTLAKLDADLGDGAVVWAGKRLADVGAALQAHCEQTGRLGLTSLARGTGQAATISATTGAPPFSYNLVTLWPWTSVPLAGEGVRWVEPTGLALGARARAHAEGSHASPIRDIYGRAQWVTGCEEQTSAAEWAALDRAGVSVIRTANSQLRLYGWRTLDEQAPNLFGAQHRDTINRVQAGCSAIAEQFVGRTVDGKGLTLGEFNGALSGFLAGMGAAFYAGANDPGFVVNTGSDVNTTASLATGVLRAEIGVRLSPSAEFVLISITATDAAGAL